MSGVSNLTLFQHHVNKKNLQVGVITLCLKDNIGEVGEAGEEMGKNVILGLGL